MDDEARDVRGLVVASVAMVANGPPRSVADDEGVGHAPPLTTPRATPHVPSSRRIEGVVGTVIDDLEGIGTASVAAGTVMVVVVAGLATSTSLLVGTAGTCAPTTNGARAT